MIRITQHPKNAGFLLLKVPHDLNTRMGTYGPAQLAPDLGGYVMAADQLDSFGAWARYQGIQVLNEVRAPGEPTQPLECGNVIDTWTENGRTIEDHCAAPYPAGRIPTFCGACGQPANPVIFGDDEPTLGLRCPGCGRVNRGGPAYCVGCGVTLPEHHLRTSALPRVKAEPRPLGEVIAEVSLTKELAERLGALAQVAP